MYYYNCSVSWAVLKKETRNESLEVGKRKKKKKKKILPGFIAVEIVGICWLE